MGAPCRIRRCVASAKADGAVDVAAEVPGFAGRGGGDGAGVADADPVVEIAETLAAAQAAAAEARSGAFRAGEAVCGRPAVAGLVHVLEVVVLLAVVDGDNAFHLALGHAEEEVAVAFLLFGHLRPIHRSREPRAVAEHFKITNAQQFEQRVTATPCTRPDSAT